MKHFCINGVRQTQSKGIKKKKKRCQGFNKYPKDRKTFTNLPRASIKSFHGEKEYGYLLYNGKQSDLDLFKKANADQLVLRLKEIRRIVWGSRY